MRSRTARVAIAGLLLVFVALTIFVLIAASTDTSGSASGSSLQETTDVIDPRVLLGSGLILTPTDVPSNITESQAREAAAPESPESVIEAVYAHCEFGTPKTMGYLNEPCWAVNVKPSARDIPWGGRLAPSASSNDQEGRTSPPRYDYKIVLVDPSTRFVASFSSYFNALPASPGGR
jgi:hypothetical protein